MSHSVCLWMYSDHETILGCYHMSLKSVSLTTCIMKVLSFLFPCIALFNVVSVEGWSIPFPSKGRLEVISASIAMGAAFFVAPLSTPAAVIDVSGSYSDPNHPNCERVIVTTAERPSEFTLTGTDGNPACAVDGTGLKTFQLVGKVDQDSNVYVDFSPKGGPKDLKGLFDSKRMAILWPDGNVWSKKD